MSLTSSGISAQDDEITTIDVFVDEKVRVGRVSSTLREVVREFNFGIVEVMPTGSAAEL